MPVRTGACSLIRLIGPIREDRTYTSSGGSHVHTFTVSASQLEELRDTCSLTLETSLPHAHTWAVEVL
jgi:hypothetical protein